MHETPETHHGSLSCPFRDGKGEVDTNAASQVFMKVLICRIGAKVFPKTKGEPTLPVTIGPTVTNDKVMAGLSECIGTVVQILERHPSFHRTSAQKKGPG